MLLGRRSFAVCAGGCLWFTSAHALAYRPFDGTDADAAALGEFELELGPSHYYRRGPQGYLVAPALVLNFGVFEHAELVLDAQQHLALGERGRGVPRVSLRGDDVMLKYVFREGTLQGKTGIGIAAEGGVLTPELPGASGFGGSLSVIASYAWPACAVHVNEWFQLTRERRADLFNGVIAEGPRSWWVRPVTELEYERDTAGARTASVLLGAIWSVQDTLALDLGLRGARVDDLNVAEVRFGLTWSVSLVETRPRNAATPL